jgi:hypothetical protein
MGMKDMGKDENNKDENNNRTGSRDGYIDDEVAISNKKVGDPVNVGVVKDKESGGHVVIHGKPAFIIHPMTKRRVNIKDIFKTDRDTKCPKCEVINGPGINMRLLVNEEIIYECPKCGHFTFCKVGSR